MGLKLRHFYLIFLSVALWDSIHGHAVITYFVQNVQATRNCASKSGLTNIEFTLAFTRDKVNDVAEFSECYMEEMNWLSSDGIQLDVINTQLKGLDLECKTSPPACLLRDNMKTITDCMQNTNVTVTVNRYGHAFAACMIETNTEYYAPFTTI